MFNGCLQGPQNESLLSAQGLRGTARGFRLSRMLQEEKSKNGMKKRTTNGI